MCDCDAESSVGRKPRRAQDMDNLAWAVRAGFEPHRGVSFTQDPPKSERLVRARAVRVPSVVLRLKPGAVSPINKRPLGAPRFSPYRP